MTISFNLVILEHSSYIVTILFLLVVLSYYILFFIKKSKPKPEKIFSSLTAIIPAHNEEKYIKDAIESVLAADFNGSKEIIVVDDGSSDNTAKIASNYKGKGVKLIRTKHRGKSASLNTALKAAKGEIIAVVDADSSIHKNSLSEAAEVLQAKNTAGVCGIVKVKNRKKVICMWVHLEQLYNSLMRLLFSKINANVTTPGPLSIYRKKALLEVNGFSTEGYSEDIDVTIRLIRKGYKIGFAEKAVAETNMPCDAGGFLRQRMRFARGMLNILKRHLRLNKAIIDVYTIPILLFTYAQAIIMAPLTLYRIISDYMTYFASKGVYINLAVAKFFFEWFSLLGFVRWAGSVFAGESPMNVITAAAIISTFLTYPLFLFAIIKFDRKFDLWHLVPIFFMFPFWLVIMTVYLLCLPEYFKKRQYNIWSKDG